jgi:hypothetical protein
MSDAKSLEAIRPFYPALPRVRKNGEETLHTEDGALKFKLSDFWKWSVSDLVSNATRGRLAEFIVASAIGVDLSGVRDEWGAFDLKAPWGLTIEVKSAAYIQTWGQRDFSIISFSTRKSRAWDPETNILSQELTHQADCYVFALLAHRERETIDPLNIAQWEFYVLATRILKNRTGSQNSISLKSLKQLGGGPVSYFQLRSVLESVTASKSS